MTAEIISVGTELLLGTTINTDAADVALLLSEYGINVYWQTVVGDNPGRVIEAVQRAKSRADMIITTGGLGPTCDDLTKSALAEALVTAKARGPVWYLATARPLGDDPAMVERIRRHRSRRPAHWHTLECPRHPGRELAPLLAAQAADAPVPTILLDCVTLWMSNILFALDDPQDAAAFETSLTEEVDELLHTMRAFPCRWVLVSGETGLGGIRAERLARVFDDGLGLANQMLAAQARDAFLVVAGRCLRLEKLEF